MKALVKEKRETGIWMKNMEKPDLGPTDIRIKIQSTAICGTDVHIYKWDEWGEKTVPTPMIVGHEYCGVVEAVGSAVDGFKEGDRVTGEGHITCGHCRNCRAGKQHLCRQTIGVGVNRPGSFAEYFTLPARNAFKLPAAIPNEYAAIMDPLGNAVHTALSFDLVGEDVLITGAGPIGIMAAAVCKHVGARHVVITDVNDTRLRMAEQCGATKGLNIAGKNGVQALRDTMEELGMTEGFDVGLEMSGVNQAILDMTHTMNHGGRIALLGIPPTQVALDWNEVVFKGLILKGIYGREMYETWYKMKNMMENGLMDAIKPVMTHQLPIDDFEEGFQAMLSGTSGKVVLNWD
eukprot:CAMPEP_0113876464 /NCGR_PEP_ID=MMETSP0780_2-20120614/5506_1 /TAXON_ID=652834 /ORGANISM="Palpitomonas bilix" /LENGTH=347 /DNA_ID=CAMNT_0000862555 /DNA_START=112 /DNA_END=1155 /DNA_ORIENTATION=- /assembly_acc=CAM_ASM_000599